MSGMMFVSIILSVAIGAFIGWITNLIAVKALFHPHKNYKLLGFDFQGLLPKRKSELADNLGNMVEGQLINIPELIEKVKPEDVEPMIDSMIEEHKNEISSVVREYIEGMLKKIPFLSGISINSLVAKITDKVSDELKKRTKQAMPSILLKAGNEVEKHISVHDIVQKKVDEMDFDKLEAMINKIADKEMKMIEYLGGILGGIVGLLQWLIQHFLLV